MLVLLALPLVAACAPVPVSPERAEALCRDEAGLADGIEGEVGAGIGSGGPAGKGAVTVTNRIFDPQTEAEFMAECIARRTAGEPKPTTVGVNIGGSF